MKRSCCILVATLMLILQGAGAKAQVMDYDFSGTLPYHNSVLQFTFTVESESMVTLFSSSWVSGGFDPILSLWTKSGALIYRQDDGGREGSTLSNGVSYSHGAWDSYFSELLHVGEYIAAISTYDNFPAGGTLAEGFDLDGAPGIFIPEWDQPANGYRTADFAFHILNVGKVVGPTPVPEPGTFLLMAVGFAGLYGLRRRFQH